MAESTLALSKNELEGEIGFHLGFGRGSANNESAWSVEQANMITSARRAGLRMFYTASAGQMDGSAGYEWSFLRPLVNLQLQSGNNVVLLPDDYHGIEGRLYISSPSVQVYRPLNVVGIGLVQAEYSKTPSMTGWPMLGAIQPLKGTQPNQGQRFQLYVFPIADVTYTLQFTYYLNCNDIDTNRPYPYGGAVHSETTKAACLAAAEQTENDRSGVQTQRFRDMLAASIVVDRRNKPQTMGYCGDHSDHAGLWDRRRDIYEAETITYNGQVY